MGRNRHRLQIIADILSIVKGGAKKTQIMHQARLSYTLLCRYITEVVDANLVSFENQNYVLTPKGEKFLDKFDVYSQHCKRIDDHLNTISNERMDLEKMCLLKY